MNDIYTCRAYRIILLYTAQRGHVAGAGLGGASGAAAVRAMTSDNEIRQRPFAVPRDVGFIRIQFDTRMCQTEISCVS